MCTNFKYPTATDGTVCVGRTMEFPNVLPWDLAVLAANASHQSQIVPNGKKWQSTYGVVGFSGFSNPQWFADGMNSAGLSAHALYMPDHCTYYAPKNDGSDIGILDVIGFCLRNVFYNRGGQGCVGNMQCGERGSTGNSHCTATAHYCA